MPIVDVLIPVYNGAHRLKRCISSIADDAEPQFKGSNVIIVNDGSIDETLSTALDLKEQFGGTLNINVINLETNHGITAALNCGMEYCESEFIYRMDVDDIWLKGRFALQYEHLLISKASIVGGQALSAKSGKYINAYLPASLKLYHFLVASPCIHPTLAFRKSKLKISHYKFLSPFDDYGFLLSNFLNSVAIKNFDVPVIIYNDYDEPSRLSKIKEQELNVKFLKIRLLLIKIIMQNKPFRNQLSNTDTALLDIMNITNASTRSEKNSWLWMVSSFNKVLSKFLRVVL